VPVRAFREAAQRRQEPGFMNPILMAVILVSLLALFAVSARQRLLLLATGAPMSAPPTDQLAVRLGRVWDFAFKQTRMRDYFWAGVAHQLIFIGFLVLLLRTLVLWGRGFVPSFNLFVLAPDTLIGAAYAFAKDVFALLVLAGVSVFLYYRTINKQRRMTLSGEGLLILGIIVAMMLGDIFYDGASQVLHSRFSADCSGKTTDLCAAVATLVAPYGQPEPLAFHLFPEPAGSAAALLLSRLPASALVVVAHAGFWIHSTLVLIFLNLLPHSKHFHVITSIPNVFLSSLEPVGRLPKVEGSTEALMARVEKAMEEGAGVETAVGKSKIVHFSWKDYLDFYTCTECGRCTDHCPAAQTGKLLSPKQLTLDLRNHLYARGKLLADANKAAPAEGQESKGDAAGANGDASGATEGAVAALEAPELVPDVIKPEVLWACTTCRACEERCPVAISYVDKIVQMRRHLVVIQGTFPPELAKPFEGMEVNGNPWNLARQDRTTWADGLDVPLASQHPKAEVLYWVGCAASYDDRAKKVARATASLLKRAGVDFAILGDEETCTGDPARRAGNEYLFTMLAEANVATLNAYQEQGKKKILTTCPHCFNTLLNEYPDFGGKYEVVHHTDFLLGLVAEKKLVPTKPVVGKVAYHDSCYLGRYNNVYESPRDILARIPGVELVEVEGINRSKGLCCGAGGAQMWLEEQTKDRVNVKRTKQLVATGATTLASACPFCMTMITDGLKTEEVEAMIDANMAGSGNGSGNTAKKEPLRQLDVVELLAQSCGIDGSVSNRPTA
jgi:Fe-S oxidoreductase